nr:IS1634 family transposase [Tessaracoccus sp. MC1679]
MLQFEQPGREPAGPVVERTSSELLWPVLTDAYERLGFDQINDEVFKALVTARIIEPTSKQDTLRVLGDLGLPVPHLNTLYNCLRRCVERDYRSRVAASCWAHATARGPVALVMYDLTTLHFEVTNEDRLRKVGMSKERRVDPQVTVGLLVTGDGFPLEVALFEGNKAETKTLIPVIEQFKTRHGINELVVVADAGMLSADNLNGLEDAGCRFIVASRQSHVPYDLGDHFERHGNYTPDDSTIETTRDMGTGRQRRTRRVVYHYSFKRHKRDDKTINAQVVKAEKVADGLRPVARDRFVTVTTDADGKKAEVNWDVIERARFCAGSRATSPTSDPTSWAAQRWWPPTGTCGTSKSPSGWPRETSKPDRSSTANANRSRPTSPSCSPPSRSPGTSRTRQGSASSASCRHFDPSERSRSPSPASSHARAAGRPRRSQKSTAGRFRW